MWIVPILNSVAANRAAFVGVFSVVMLVATAWPAATGAIDEDATDPEAKSTDGAPPEVKDLAEQLASKNEPPPIPDHEAGRKHPYPVFPDDFDWSEQDRVRAAWEDLHKRFEEAAPSLVAHFGDKRYAATFTSPTGAWRNNSVSDICHHIFNANVMPFSLPPGYRSVGPDVFKEDGGRVELWKSYRGRPLVDLQIKVIERLIEWDERIDKKQSSSHKEYRERLRKKAEQIRATGKPEHGLAIGDFYTFAKKSDRKSTKR